MFAGRDRRKHPRYVLPSMYTEIAVRPIEEETFRFAGHAYDISEGGMRFEIDDALEPGSSAAIRIQLPGAQWMRPADRRPVYVMANIVWVEQDDLDHPGPVRMACVFRTFVQEGDRERLMRRLMSGRFSLAA